MRIARNLRLSLRALSTHTLRTGLAVAGTGIGVAGVLVLTAIGEGAGAEVARQIDSLGRNVLVVTAARLESRGGRPLQGDDWTRRLRVEDAVAIVRASPALARAAPVQQRAMRAKYGPLLTPVTVIGTTPEWPLIRQFALASGRFFDHAENARRERVAVLGHDVRRNLFPDSVDPLGRTLRIGTVPFRIVGVLVSKGMSVDGNANEDDRIIVPLETALRRLFDLDYLSMIYLEAAASSVMAEAERDAAATLRIRHDLPPAGGDDFVIQDQRVLLAAQLATQNSFRRLITGLGFVSLLIAGLGILSIMLLSLRERRHEIGLRVAVGARRGDILVQFLAEASLLAAAGGVLGIVLGIGLAAVVSSATQWDASVSAATLAITIASTAAIGIGFGVFPAWRAATLDPISSLQSD